MALTNYRAYKWLIDLLDDAPDQRYGMSLEQINNAYRMQRRKIYEFERGGLLSPDDIERDYKWYKEENETDKDYSKKDYISYKTFLNWRAAIWKNFGLDIQHPVINGVAKNSYIIENRDELDALKTLREMIAFLSEDEKRAYGDKNNFKNNRRGRPKKIQSEHSVSIGFVSTADTRMESASSGFGYQYAEEPELLGIIQFAMTFAEALVIKYGKILSLEQKKEMDYKKDEPFIFEPQQLKQINGRWYVAGCLYRYGDRETLKTVIYDIERLRLWDGTDDIEIPTYTLKEVFDIEGLLPSDRSDYFDPERVVSLYMRAAGSFLDEQPFCEAQEKVEEGLLYNLYKMYVKPNDDFFLRYMAYGDELQVFNPFKKIERTSTDISDEQIHYLRRLREQEL